MTKRAAIDANHHKGLIVSDSIDHTPLDVTGEELANARPAHVAIVDGSGNQITSFGGSGGTSATDDSAFTVGSGSGTPVMGIVTTDSVDSGDVGVIGILANRQQKVTLFDSAGTELAVGGGTQYTEDAAAAANPIGNAVNLIRSDTPATVTSTDGDNVAQRGTNYGAAYTQIVTSAGAFVDTFGGGTQFADGAARGTATGTLAMVDDGVNIQSLSGDSSGRLNVNNISGTVSLPTGASTSALQTTGNTSLSTIAGAVSGTEMQVDVITLPAITATDLDIRNLVFATDKVDISGSTLAANSGVDIGDVTVNNASGASAVNIQDGGNSITVDGTVTANAGSGTFTVAGAVTNTVLSVVGGGTEATAQRVTIANDSTGVLSVDDNGGSLTVDGTVAISGTVTVASHAVTNAGTFATQVTASATGGYTPGKLVSAASTNATSIKASAGTLGFLTASNVNASARYVKLYNKASAPTVGTDVPVFTFIIPGNTAGAGTNIPIPPQGLNFTTGIALALTTEATDAGSTGVALAEIVVNWGTI